jgi:hypothetical protein
MTMGHQSTSSTEFSRNKPSPPIMPRHIPANFDEYKIVEFMLRKILNSASTPFPVRSILNIFPGRKPAEPKLPGP